MSDENALLAAIWKHPHDDTVRLAYSDWLQENGDPARAEFIRVQCALSQLDEWDTSPQRAELEKREKALWTKNAKTWKAALPDRQLKTAGFRRGFPHPQFRSITAAKFLQLTGADFAGAPLWSFGFPTNHKLLPKLLACPHLLRCGTLSLNHWITDADDMRAVATSPYVRNVADLSFNSSRVGDDGAEALAENASGLPHLKHLDLESCHLTDRGLAALVASPLARELRSLRLWGNVLGAGGFRAIAGASDLTRLEKLQVTHCERRVLSWENWEPITSDAVAALCAAPHLISLKSLALDPRDFGADGVQTMCATRPVFQLRALQLTPYPGIYDDGAEALAAWPALAEVRELNLFNNQIGDRGALAMARSPYLNNITALRLDLNSFGTDAQAALTARFGAAVRF